MVINRFEGHYSFLSNFVSASVELDGVVYPAVENAFQAAKTLNLNQREVLRQCTAGHAKKAGRQLDLRPDWESVKVHVMRLLLQQKFAAGSELARSLLATGDAYICEGNTWHDNFWGACYCDRCVYTTKQNTLGMLLMQIRGDMSHG
jgi:ribA/ribD-fused uncharacterized protein